MIVRKLVFISALLISGLGMVFPLAAQVDFPIGSYRAAGPMRLFA